MGGTYATDTLDQAAGFLAVCGHVRRFNPARHSGPPLREFLDTLFPTGTSVYRVLRPYTVVSAGNILLGLGRLHLIEINRLRKDINAQEAPFRDILTKSWGLDSDPLVEDDLAFLTSEPYLNLLRLGHAKGDHGSGELIMPHNQIDGLLRKLGWRPLREKDPTLGLDDSTEELQSTADSFAGSDATEAISDTHGLQEIAPRRHRTAAQEEPSFHLAEPVLLSHYVAPEPRMAPTESELAELDAESVSLLLDPQVLLTGDSFTMVQRRTTYREAPDPLARNYDESAANYDFSLENGAFLDIDAQLPRQQPLSDVEMQLDNHTLEVDLSSSDDAPLEVPLEVSASYQDLGPDDAQLSLISSDNSSLGRRTKNDWRGNDSPWADDVGFYGNEEEEEEEDVQPGNPETNGLPNKPSSGAASPDLSNKNAPEPELLVLNPQHTPPANLLSPTAYHRDPHATPPGSPPSFDSLLRLSNSARRLPALVPGIDYEIPSPPDFEGSGSGPRPNYSSSNSEASASAICERRPVAKATAPGVILDNMISQSQNPNENMIFQLERALEWERLVRPPAPPPPLRADSPWPTEEEMPAVLARLRQQLAAGPANLGDHPAASASEQQLEGDLDLALRYESPRIASQVGSVVLSLSSREPSPQQGQAKATEIISNMARTSMGQPPYVENLPLSPGRSDESHNVPVLPGRPVDEAEHSWGQALDGEFYDTRFTEEPMDSHERRVGTSLLLGSSIDDSETSDGFLKIRDSELRGMPYPSSISFDESIILPSSSESVVSKTAQALSDPNYYSPVKTAVTRASGDEQAPGTEDEDWQPAHDASPPSLPSLPVLEDVSSTSPGVFPVPTENMRHSEAVGTHNADRPENAEQELANYQDGNNYSGAEIDDPIDGDMWDTRASVRRVEDRPPRNTLAWQGQSHMQARNIDLFTPTERALRLSIDPSPFWSVGNDELTAYVRRALDSADGELSFTELCKDAPWKANGFEDFNLDSDLFRTLLSAAGHDSIRLKQKTSIVDSELIILDPMSRPAAA